MVKLKKLMDKGEQKIYGGVKDPMVSMGLEVEHALQWEGVGELPGGKGELPRELLEVIAHDDSRRLHFDGSGPAEWMYGPFYYPASVINSFLGETKYNQRGEATWPWQNYSYHQQGMAHGCHWHLAPTDYAAREVGSNIRAFQIMWNTAVTIAPIFSPFLVYGDELRFRLRAEASTWCDTQYKFYRDPKQLDEDMYVNEGVFQSGMDRAAITGNPSSPSPSYHRLPEGKKWEGPWKTHLTARGIKWEVPESLTTVRQPGSKPTTIEIRYGETHPCLAAAGFRVFQMILGRCIRRGRDVRLKTPYRSNLYSLQRELAKRRDIYDILKTGGALRFVEGHGLPSLEERLFNTPWDCLKAWIDKNRPEREGYLRRVMWLYWLEKRPAEFADKLWELGEEEFGWHPWQEFSV